MAQRKKTSRGAASGGFKNFMLTAVVLFTLAGMIVGWAKTNNIQSFPAALDYFRSWSTHLQNCGGDANRLFWGGCVEGGNEGGPPSTTPSSGSPTVGSPSEPAIKPGDPKAKTAALKTLDGLTIADPKEVAYERSEWRHWVDPDDNGCDARQDILIRDGKNIVKDPKVCKVISGTWVDPYSGITFTDPGQLDIDHMIPLAAAARSGGQEWSSEKKEQYANDPAVLIAASASENRSKSDKTASEYMPPNQGYRCQYSEQYVSVAGKYKLTISKADEVALRAALVQSCT